jgi:hypothetical protein
MDMDMDMDMEVERKMELSLLENSLNMLELKYEATNYKQHPSVGTSPFDRTLPLIYVESLKEQEFGELEKKLIHK